MSALSDALDYLGGAIDKPGRAVRGGLAGRPDELLAFLPFSDSMGLTDPSRKVSGTDLLHQYAGSTGSGVGDEALGMGIDLATDPLTYLGGIGGARVGAKAGGRLAGAAARRGPGYATTADDLIRGLAGRADDAALDATSHLSALGNRAPGVFSEVPEGSRLLGAGEEGVAFGTPAGDVVRLGTPAGGAGRPVSDNVLQATRAADYTGPAGDVVRAERVPMAEAVGDTPYWLRGSGVPGQTRTGAVRRSLADEGLTFTDPHAGNLGLVGGAAKVIDPGAVAATAAFRGGYQPVAQAGRPGLLTRAILDLLGGQGATRRAIDAGLAAPDYQTMLGRRGALAGASLGLGE